MSESCRRRVAFALLPLLAVTGLCAQVPATAAAPIADTPLLHLSIGGPAVWRMRLGPTNAGSLLASESGQKLVRSLLDPFEDNLRQLLGAGTTPWETARVRLLEYAGSLEISVWATPDPLHPIVTLRLCADGKTDLPALTGDLLRVLRSARGAEFAPSDAGAPRLLALSPRDALLEPFAHGDDLVAAIAPPADMAVARERLLRAPAAVPRHLQAPLRFAFDTGAAVRHYLKHAPESTIWRALGADSLHACTLQLGAAGPHVQLEIAHTFTAGERAIFGFLFPDVQRMSALGHLHAATGGAAMTKAGHLDFGALYETVLRLLRRDDEPGEAAERRLQEYVGDRKTGILAQLTGDYLLWGSGEDFELDDGKPLDWGIALQARDDAACRQAFDSVRREWGMTKLSEDDLGDGCLLQRVGGLFEMRVLQGRGILAFAYGPGARERLQAIADRCKAAPADDATAPAFTNSIHRHAPPGWNGYAQGDIAGLLTQVAIGLQTLQEFAAELPDLTDFALADTQQETVVRLLDSHGLRTARSLTGHADGRWCLRILW